MTEVPLSNRIQQLAHELTPAQAKIARHITLDPQSLAHSTIRELSKKVGVSNSAVVRFAQALGYHGYPELQAAAREILAHRLSLVERYAPSAHGGAAGPVEQILVQDLRNLEATNRELSREALAAAAAALAAARRVYVLGYRNSAAMGILLASSLSRLLEDVIQVFADYGDASDKLAGFTDRDVVVAISFPRYAHCTLRAVELARRRGCYVVALTDGPASPIAQRADAAFFARVESDVLPNSFVGVVGLVNAILAAVSDEAQANAAQRLARWEDAVRHLGVLHEHALEAAGRHGRPAARDGPEGS